jgi:hypothetical protein
MSGALARIYEVVMVRSVRRRVLVFGGLGACAALSFAFDAAAAVDCSSLPGTIIYGAGGSAQAPLLTSLGTALAKLSSPITVVYSDGGSACAGYSDLVTPTSITGTALYWDGSGNTQTCTLDLGGDPVTFAVMGNAADLCTTVTVPEGGTAFGVFLGPVQPVDFAVPAQSSATSISTEAAYYLWGFDAVDAAHQVLPWTTPANIFTRSASSFVNLFVALDTGVPAATIAVKGTLESTNTGTVTALNALNSGPASTGIGFVSGEVVDLNRSEIRALPYQHTGQSCGYTPDSDSTTAFDKINVRNGQYWLWSPVHLYAAVGANNAITDPNTANLIGWLDGTVTPPAELDVFSVELAAYNVPQCAMDVWRDGDLAPLYSNEPASSCTCQYDFATNTASALRPSTCTTCTQDSDCATNHCRNIGPPPDAGGPSGGYCEVN